MSCEHPGFARGSELTLQAEREMLVLQSHKKK